jgi:hypothetical protein
VLKLPLLTLGFFALVAAALAEPAAPAFTPVARSALVVLEAARTPSALLVRAHRSSGATPLAAGDLVMTINGRSVSVSPNADGSFSARWPPGESAGATRIEVVLAHDGIREVLDGTLPAVAGASGAPAGLLGDHKQMAWWVLNIAIVLIAVLAISRRMS